VYLQVFREAKRTAPSIVYLPHIHQWWPVVGETVRSTILTLISDLDPSSPVLLLATSEQGHEELDFEVRTRSYCYFQKPYSSVELTCL